MKKIFLFLVLTIGFVCESKAQEYSEIYYYIETPNKKYGSSFFIYSVQIQNYGKKMIYNLTSISEGDDVDKEIQELKEKHDWDVYNYSSKYSNDKYDTYSKYIPGLSGPLWPITSSMTKYFSISKDKQTIIRWDDSSSTRNYYKRVTISDLKEMSAVKIPSFLE